DLPFDVQMAEIEFDPDTYEPLPVYKPAATRAQVEKALDMLAAAERPLIVAGGGVINADAAPQLVEFDFVLGIGNRWANRHTGGLDTYRRGRTFVHVDIEPTQIGRVFPPDYGIVSDASAALDLFVDVARERKAGGRLPDWSEWVSQCDRRKRSLQRRTHFDNVPVKPQRVYEEMNRAFSRNARYVSTIGLSQIAGAQFLHIYEPRHWINCGQ